ncbi:MAG: class I SAM-dependent methyltransferase, partial [Nanoarchaeota archaeon]
KVITCAATFYDLDDPNKAVSQMKNLLMEDGIICIQVSYLYDTVCDMNFYDFCQEHLTYYSLKTLIHLFKQNDLEIFDASTNSVNGGSIRIMVSHPGKFKKSTTNLKYFLLKEKIFHLEHPLTYKRLAELIDMSVDMVKNYIQKLKGDLIGLGASTKGNILIQLCGLSKKDMSYLSDRNPLKHGLKTLGTDIDIISEEEAREKNPKCMLLIPWNFKNEIVEREKDYIKNGGNLLFVMPYPYILNKEGEFRL